MSNSKKAIKNGIFSLYAQIVMYILRFFNRRIFVMVLSTEFLGYRGLFGDVFTLLNVTELGIGSVVIYKLYKELAQENIDRINKLMSIYRFLYHIIGTTIFLLGVVLSFFLPYIVRGETVSWGYLRVIYFLMLISTVSTYFFAYRNTIYIASQNEYKTVNISVMVNLIFSAVDLIVLIVFKNFIIYLLFDIMKSIVSNYVIYRKAKKDFPYLDDSYRISYKDIKEERIFFDTKNILFSKIAGTVYRGVDNIFVSRFFGISNVTIFGNYIQLYSNTRGLTFQKIISGINPTVANIMHSNRDLESKKLLFKRIDFFNHVISTYFSIGFLLFAHTFISLWMGPNYIFTFQFLAVYSIYIYIENSNEAVCTFRIPYGEFEFDRKYMALAAIGNIVLSIIFLKIFGLPGIVLGTIFAFFFIGYGRAKFVYNKVFDMSIIHYIKKHLAFLVDYVIIYIIVIFLSFKLDDTVGSVLNRLLIYILVPAAYFAIRYFKSADMKDLLTYLKSTLLQYNRIRKLYMKIFNKQEDL